MALMGSLSRGGHHGGARGGMARGGARGAARGRGHARGRGPSSAKGASHGGNKMAWLLQGLSPIDLMAMAMGAGAMGIIGRKAFHDNTVAAFMAIAGAIVMDLLIVRPLFSVLLRFASQPSSGLEGMISHTAEAATTFDSTGKGLIKLCLDGQNSQVLAMLEESELAAGIRVRRGDPLVVLEVDATRNICRVSRDIASPEQ